MALDVYLQKKPSPPEVFNSCFLQFQDDGYYWFLYDFFDKLAEQSGQMIDLYDGAFFKGENLDLLNQTINQAKKAISNKPDSWEELIGTTFEKGIKTKVEKMYSTVYKKELESILSKLENAISTAKEKDLGVCFFGD
jgi:hypothetical protein